MATQLVFIEKGAAALEVRKSLLDLAAVQPDVSFVLIQARDGDAQSPAIELDAGIRSRFFFVSDGVRVVDTVIGAALPLKAIADEVRRGAHDYAGVLLAVRDNTLTMGASLTARLERHVALPVTLLPSPAAPGTTTTAS